MKKIFYILLITQLTISLSYSQSGWVKQNLTADLEFDAVWFVNQNTGFLGAVWFDTSVIYKTTNSGLNWSAIYADGGGGYISLYFLNDNTGFATSYGVLKTTNAGMNWNLKYHIPAVLISLLFTSHDTGYACGKYNTMIKTTNGGENWFTQTIIGGHHNNMCFVDNNIGFTVSEYDYIIKTTNGGINWILKNVGNFARLYAVNFINSETGFCGGWNGQNMLIYKTTNGGENWSQTVGLPVGVIKRISFVNSETGYAVGSSILKTTNTGQNWQIQQNLGWTELYSVYFINAFTGYACGIDNSNQKGVLYKTTTGGEPIGIQPISSEVPKQFILHQNYPNPFNPTTKIKFSIPPSKGVRGMITRLVIYDILGREIAVLVNERLNPGVYDVEWDGYNFASGVYFYQLSINNEQFSTKKMVLIK